MNTYFHLCDCTCSNVMCVCSTICGSNKKYLCSFYLFLEVICIAHVFQSFSSFFVWKTYFLGVFVTYFMCKLSRKFNWSNSQVFQLWIEIFASFFVSTSRVLCEKGLPAKILSYPRKLSNHFFKGHFVGHLF